MSTLTNIIEQNIADPNLTNTDLARKTGLSERQFYRKIEMLTGLSPNKFIREVRLKKAEKLLKSGDYQTVKEVALRVGFIKVSWFSQLFERHMGQRPIELLKNV